MRISSSNNNSLIVETCKTTWLRNPNSTLRVLGTCEKRTATMTSREFWIMKALGVTKNFLREAERGCLQNLATHKTF